MALTIITYHETARSESPFSSNWNFVQSNFGKVKHSDVTIERVHVSWNSPATNSLMFFSKTLEWDRLKDVSVTRQEVTEDLFMSHTYLSIYYYFTTNPLSTPCFVWLPLITVRLRNLTWFRAKQVTGLVCAPHWAKPGSREDGWVAQIIWSNELLKNY